MSAPASAPRRAEAAPKTAGAVRRMSALPDDFDVTAWTRDACEASGVPFTVEDPLTLAKLRDLAEHPV